MKLVLFGFVLFGMFINGFSQDYLRESVIKLTEVSNDPKYGYSQTNPIKIGTKIKGGHFLNALVGPNGETVTWHLSGSCCEFKSDKAAFGKGFLDVYQVWYDGGKPITLYINGCDYEFLKCPWGFTFLTDKKNKIAKK